MPTGVKNMSVSEGFRVDPFDTKLSIREDDIEHWVKVVRLLCGIRDRASYKRHKRKDVHYKIERLCAEMVPHQAKDVAERLCAELDKSVEP